MFKQFSLTVHSRWMFLVGCTLAFHLVGPLRAEDAGTLIRRHLEAGEFSLAGRVASQAGSEQRDGWLQQIASRQAAAGMFQSSLRTASNIRSDSIRAATFGELANQPVGGMPARGGAALADFDTLIQLMESTIAPDTWDSVGGPGAVESFPTGVLVDASGLMKRGVLAPESVGTLEALRAAAAARSKDAELRHASRLRKVSLTKLERHVQMRWAAGLAPDEAMQNLAGLQRVKYVFFYPETRDIVLAGPAGDFTRDLEGRVVGVETGVPVLQLDDLVVALRNSLTEGGRFGCAITPRQENLAAVKAYLAETATRSLKPQEREAWLDGIRSRLGKQDVSVFGIDPRTRAARVLVEADYRMKLVGMGLEEGTAGVTSYLDSVVPAPDGSLPPMDVLRWWFTLNYEAVRGTKARDAFEFQGTGVKVLSENELLTERGERVHTGKSTADNLQFVHSFTKHFDSLAKKYPIYAELRNVFDLAMVAAVIESHDLHGQSGWEIRHFADADRYEVTMRAAPKRVDTVINHRIVDRRHIIVGVSGGVSVETKGLVQPDQIRLDDYGLLHGERAQARPKPVEDRWWWD